MGGLQSCSGKVTNEQRKALKKSTDIENILSKRSKAARDEIKLLLLGFFFILFLIFLFLFICFINLFYYLFFDLFFIKLIKLNIFIK